MAESSENLHDNSNDSVSCKEILDFISEESCSSEHSTKFNDKLSFEEELYQHTNSIIWAFGYGEEAAKKTEENINAYKKQFLEKHFVLPNNDKSDKNVVFEDTQPSSSTNQICIEKTPYSEKNNISNTRKRARCSETSDTWASHQSRGTPLPSLPWANNAEVWQTMVYKEEATARTRNCRLFEDPSSFLPRMRAILVDWIMEVCEVYRLRRVTYYLAVDYIDRFLTIKPKVPKKQLQLVGISSLFIAAKLEEIYPPKLSEFSYVCDGACTTDDILECELLILNTLGWDVNPMTPSGWLNVYMQIYYNNKYYQNETNNEKATHEQYKDSFFFYPQYSSFRFVMASHLIDLFSLDPGFLLFNYSVIAAGAMYYLFGRTIALKVSGLVWDDLKHCTEYMAVFYSIMRHSNDPKLQSIIIHEIDQRREATYGFLKPLVSNLNGSEHHTLQTHVVDLKYFEKATLLRLERMGFSVKKTFETKSLKGKTDLSDDTKNEEKTENEEFQVVMFEVEKVAINSGCETTTISNSWCNSDNTYFTKKTKYTFDEILIGINDTTNKILFSHKLGYDVKVDKKD